VRKPSGVKKIGAFGIFAAWLPVDWERFTGNWQALEDICYEIEWAIGIYSAYDLIQWGRRVGLITAFEYDAWFNMLQN
jgi:hypothetical protein